MARGLFYHVLFIIICTWNPLASAGEEAVTCPLNNALSYFHGRPSICPARLTFPLISKATDLPPLTRRWSLLPGDDLGKGVISLEVKERARDLVRCLGTTGYVYLFNHSIPEDTVLTAFRQSRKYFDLSEKKRKRWLISPPPVDPYSRSADSTITGTKLWFNIQKFSRPFPEFPLPKLLPSLQALEAESARVGREVLQLIALGLDVEEIDVFRNYTQALDDPSVKSTSALRSSLYIPLKKGVDVPHSLHLSKPTTNLGLISLVYSDLVPGFQVFHAIKEWVPVDPLPGAVILMAGATLRLLTGGTITPWMHRVAPPPVVRKGDGGWRTTLGRPESQSIVYFMDPDEESVLKPLKGGPRLTTKQLYDNNNFLSQ